MQPGRPAADPGETSVYEFVRQGAANLRVDLPVARKCDADLAVVLATTPLGRSRGGSVVREALHNDDEAFVRRATQLIRNAVDFSLESGAQAASEGRIQGFTLVTQYESRAVRGVVAFVPRGLANSLGVDSLDRGVGPDLERALQILARRFDVVPLI